MERSSERCTILEAPYYTKGMKMNWKSYNEERKLRFCNLHLTKDVIFADGGMPVLDSFDEDLPEGFIPFNMAVKSKDYGNGVHFFIDDYQFERVWNTPERYIPMLKKFHCVIAPDFSVYLDVPKAVNMWNIYRNRLLARYMQDEGIKVIPNVSIVPLGLDDEVFSGLEGCNTIAISNVQANSGEFKSNWFRFVKKTVEVLNPDRIVVYGNRTTLSSHPNVVYVENKTINRLRLCRRK